MRERAAQARQGRRTELARAAESMACRHLERLGFQVVGRNVRVGRLELDVIAERGPLCVFCEVRSRSSDRVMTPAQSITPAKANRVRRAAAQWLRDNRRDFRQVRFDVAAVVFTPPPPRFNYLEGAF